jgi:hypothetical protein
MNVYEQEALIRRSVRERAMDLLADGRWHSSREIAQVAPSAARRLWEAERDGARIEKRKTGPDQWLWRLVPEDRQLTLI